MMEQREFKSATKSEIALAKEIERLRRELAKRDGELALERAKNVSIVEHFENTPVWLTPKKVIFFEKTTIIYWMDGDKTVVKCSDEDAYSKEAGYMLCFLKKIAGNRTTELYELLKPLYDESSVEHVKSSTKRKREKRAEKAKHKGKAKVIPSRPTRTKKAASRSADKKKTEVTDAADKDSVTKA